MNLQKIIDNISERKNVTKKYKEDIEKILSWITELDINVYIESKNINAKYYYTFPSGEQKYFSSITGPNEIKIIIIDGECKFFHDWNNGEIRNDQYVDIENFYYINIKQCNTAIFSILTQLENLGTRENVAKEIEKIIEIIK